MPGIAGIIGNKANLATLKIMCEKINHFSYKTERLHLQGASLARVHCGRVNIQSQPVFSADKRYVGVLIGEIFGIDDLPDELIDNEAQLFVERFAAEGISLLPKINGQYSACVFDTRHKTAYLVSDRWGSRPVYYALSDGNLFFGPETKALLAAGLPKNINYAAFSDMFHFGYIFGNKTLFEGTEQLPVASVLIFREGSINIVSYWDYPFDEASYSENKLPESKFREQKEELKIAMKNAVVRQVRKNSAKLLVPLSGGLDSRFVAALSHELTGEQINTYTIGSSRSEEQLYGSQVARALGLPHRAFELMPDDIWEALPSLSYLSDGMFAMLPPSIIYRPSLEYCNSSEIVLTPTLCDVLFGSNMKRKSFINLRKNPSRERANEILTNHHNQINEEYLQLVFEKSFYQKHIKDHWKQSPKQHIDRYPHPLHCYFMMMHKERSRRFIMTGNHFHNLYFDVRMPSYDNELVDLAFRIPMVFKKNKNIYRFAFAEMFPELAKIKYEGSHLPVNAPDFLIDLLHLRDKCLIVAKTMPVFEKLADKLMSQSYILLEQWFRTDLRSNMHTLLLDNRTIDRGIFNRKGVETILLRHDKSHEDHSRLLRQMVNVEYFFRNFID